ncbi:MAG: hypothetical protein RLY74_1070, partial [Actinomycetota bacterium]
MKLKMNRSMVALWIILALTFLVTGLVDSYFFSIPLQLAAPLGLLAAGQTIVMLTGGIDLSLAMIATGAAYIVSVKSESGLLISLSYALIFCVVTGAINGVAVG